jgi:hypothetical protein
VAELRRQVHQGKASTDVAAIFWINIVRAFFLANVSGHVF